MSCKKCLKLYDTSVHKPMVLFNCAHTLCNECVLNINTCPTCSNEIKSKTVNWEILDLIEEGAIQTNEANNKQENENIIIASIDEPVITEEPIEVNINRQPFLIINTPEREEAILEFNKGMSKWGALQHFKAIEHFDKGIKADPTYFENYMRKAYVLNCIKKYADVVECYDKAIKYLPNELEAYYGKAEALVNLKKYNDAIKEYGKIIKIDPEQTDAKIERENCLRELENK